MFLLSLIAALAGTPLRQAEAAHDFACWLAGVGGDDTITEPDGRVGDDSGATIKAEITQASVVLAVAGSLPVTFAAAPQQAEHVPACLLQNTTRLSYGSARRNALLQRFLF
jgi:hypothetical protein